LAAVGQPGLFDGALLAGNVMDFVLAGVRVKVLERVAAHLRPEGFLVVGCRTDRGFSPNELDHALPSCGLVLELRFSAWQLRPWQPDATFCVSILRRTAAPLSPAA
jgi:hypothetical protein